MFKAALVALALLLSACSVVPQSRPAPEVTGAEMVPSAALPFPTVESFPPFELVGTGCPDGLDAYAYGDFIHEEHHYRLFALIRQSRFVSFVLLDFTAELVWYGIVIEDRELRVIEHFPLAIAPDRYPHPCDAMQKPTA